MVGPERPSAVVELNVGDVDAKRLSEFHLHRLPFDWGCVGDRGLDRRDALWAWRAGRMRLAGGLPGYEGAGSQPHAVNPAYDGVTAPSDRIADLSGRVAGSPHPADCLDMLV